MATIIRPYTSLCDLTYIDRRTNSEMLLTLLLSSISTIFSMDALIGLSSTTEYFKSLSAPGEQILPHYIQIIIIQQPYIQMI